MIPFQDLVVALDNWRMRQGLPLSSGDVPAAPVAAAKPAAAPAPVVMTPKPAPAAYVAPAAAYVAPTAAAATQPRPGTDSDVLAIDDAEVEDDLYENEGNDFSMQFGESGNPVGTASGSIGGYEPPPGQASYDPQADAPESAPFPEESYEEPPPAEMYDDPAYDEPVAAAPAPESTVDAPLPEEELDEDAEFARLYAAANAGSDTDGETPDEATVVGGDHDKHR